MIRKGDKIRAYAIFGKPAINAEVLADYDGTSGRVGIVIQGGEYDDRTTAVGLAQIVGTPEYRERVRGRPGE